MSSSIRLPKPLDGDDKNTDMTFNRVCSVTDNMANSVNSSLNDTYTKTTISEQIPLHTHVKQAVNHYLDAFDENAPTNLYETFLQEVERPLIEVVLEKTRGNQSKTALILGLNRGTLRKKMQQYGLK